LATLVIGSFSLSASPASQTVLAGIGTNYTVTVTTNNTFSGSVNLGVSGLPLGVGASFSPASLSTNGNSTLSITTSSNTPAGSYALTINGTNGSSISSTTVALIINTLSANPGTLLWTNGAADINWSSVLNWTNLTSGGNGPPGTANDVVFSNVSTAATSGTVDNIVNDNATINSLTYENTNGFHTTQIAAGQISSVVGGSGLLVGTETDLSNAASVYSTITGAGGSLVVSNVNANLIVRQGSANSGSALKATLDLSGLDNFKATINQVQLGSLGTIVRPSGTLYLAKTNFIVASGASPAILIGGQSGNGGNGSLLYLGQTNSIFANGISVATVKQQNCSMLFNPAFISSNPVAVFRAADGVSRVPSWLIGDSGNSGGTVNTTGTNDFTGGTVDALAGTMTLGNSSVNSGGSGSPSGTLTFSAGTINVNTLQIGCQNSGGGSTNNSATGIMNVNGVATLTVNVGMELGHVSIAVGTNATKGTLNVNGGTVQATNIFGGGGISTINLNSGTMDLQAGNPFPGSVANVSSLTVGANGAGGNALLENAAMISVSNTITIAANGIIAGNTLITSPGLIVSGAIAPGTAARVIGAITNSGNVTLGMGGNYVVTVEDVGTGPDVGWSFLQTAGKIDVESAGTNSFTINPQSFDPNNSGLVTNFNNNTNYDWPIATAAGGITNFAANKFTVDDSLFANDLAGGYFYIRTNGNSLILSFTNNHPSSAGTVTFYRTGNSMVIPVATLAGNWSDPDGDPVALVSVDSSTNGAGLGTDGSFVFYTNVNVVADEIFYTVQDVRTNPPAIYRAGDTQRIATGKIILLPPPPISNVALSGGSLIFSGSGGMAGANYYLLASTNVALPISQWPVIATNSFDAGGNFYCTNSTSPEAPQVFYLLRLQ
jgi:hypothetical protein